jgi:5-(carboxyamino)imidazole ribonucleotide synthase
MSMDKTRIGILGAGQLARMLALSAHPLGLCVKVLATHAGDPAAQVVSDALLGSLSDERVLRKFLSEVDFLTFESEFVDTSLLSRCLPNHVQVFPSLTAIDKIQDRLSQKQLLDHLKIPTSAWLPVDSAADLAKAAANFRQGFVLKQRRFGYDGNGTFVFRESKKYDPSVLLKSKFGFIAEGFVDFKRELATSFVRSRKGEFLALPLVESVQKEARCFSVSGPVRYPKIAKLNSAFKRLLKELDYVGILAVEIFETARGLMVNELAPRVHNSAHYSQDALTCDQFEYHLRAGLGWTLPKVELLRPGFAMVNLLAEGHKEIRLSPSTTGKLHWYGKSVNRPGRKLGHINVIDLNGKRALQRALKWRKDFQL